MNITPSDYHSLETKSKYMSNSQWKSWLECAARTRAELAGEYVPTMTVPMLVGSYVDRALTAPDELEFLCAAHKDEIFGKKGEKYSDFRRADILIERILSDKVWSEIMKSAKTQVVMCGTIAGVEWLYMSDIQIERKGSETLLDLKTTASFDDEWAQDSDGKNRKISWIDAAGYWRQLAVGRELFQQSHGSVPVCGVIAAKKAAAEDRPVGLGLWVMDDSERFNNEILRIQSLTPQVLSWKRGEVEAPRCGKCDYCLASSSFESEQVAVSGRMFTV